MRGLQACLDFYFWRDHRFNRHLIHHLEQCSSQSKSRQSHLLVWLKLWHSSCACYASLVSQGCSTQVYSCEMHSKPLLAYSSSRWAYPWEVWPPDSLHPWTSHTHSRSWSQSHPSLHFHLLIWELHTYIVRIELHQVPLIRDSLQEHLWIDRNFQLPLSTCILQQHSWYHLRSHVLPLCKVYNDQLPLSILWWFLLKLTLPDHWRQLPPEKVAQSGTWPTTLIWRSWHLDHRTSLSSLQLFLLHQDHTYRTRVTPYHPESNSLSVAGVSSTCMKREVFVYRLSWLYQDGYWIVSESNLAWLCLWVSERVCYGVWHPPTQAVPQVWQYLSCSLLKAP